MARKSNIVSIEDARSASRSRYARGNAPRRQSRPDERDERADEPRRQRSRSRANTSASAQARGEQRKRPAREKRAKQGEKPQGKTTASGKRDQRRRNRRKERADKMYTRQFESGKAPETPAEGAPRAALYEGKMGSSHRKSARMQKASGAAPVSAKINPAGWLSGLNVSARSLKIGTVLVCVVLTCLFLYTPAQHYYQSLREGDRLAAEYASIEQRNGALDAQNDELASDAGMEDAVRQKYGYIVAGEQTAVVTGLSEAATDSARGNENIEANVLSSSVKAPEEWYTPYLDAFFGVS